MTRLAAVLVTGLVLAGCSTGDGTDLDAREPAQTAPGTAANPGTASAPPVGVAPMTTEMAAEASTLPAEPIDTSSTTGGATTPTSVAEVPETGVPGLDADDRFCAAWSRFGGSFQVVAVHAAFGDGSAESTARYELMAAPTVVEAYAAMGENWPDAIADEFDAVRTGRFGPLADRLSVGLESLVAAGLDDALAESLRAAWLDALAGRDALAADITVDLSAELTAIVDDAVDDHLAVVGPWADDESLVTDVATPLTDAYLANECPDQGTLAGQEVG